MQLSIKKPIPLIETGFIYSFIYQLSIYLRGHWIYPETAFFSTCFIKNDGKSRDSYGPIAKMLDKSVILANIDIQNSAFWACSVTLNCFTVFFCFFYCHSSSFVFRIKGTEIIIVTINPKINHPFIIFI